MNELQLNKEQMRDIKWYVNTQVEITKVLDDSSKETISPYFRSKTYTSLLNDKSDEHNANEAFQKMNQGMEEFVHRGSNWRMNKVNKMELNIVRYLPLSGSSYITLPSKLQAGKSIINIKNDDNKCFLWSILAAIYPVAHHAQQVIITNHLKMN